MLCSLGALHITNDNVAESWLDDDQVSDMSAGGNGPVDRNEVTGLIVAYVAWRRPEFHLVLPLQGMYNAYAAVKTYWSDTVNMDNLRGADATGVATPGAQEISSTSDGVTGNGNTTHTYSGDSFY